MKGKWAETLAKKYLLAKGYVLLAENKRTPYGEIDLWMQDGEIFVAVEVKQRKDDAYGTPLEAITPLKYSRIYHSVVHILGRDDVTVRLEGVLVYGTTRSFRLEHIVLE